MTPIELATLRGQHEANLEAVTAYAGQLVEKDAEIKQLKEVGNKSNRHCCNSPTTFKFLHKTYNHCEKQQKNK